MTEVDYILTVILREATNNTLSGFQRVSEQFWLVSNVYSWILHLCRCKIDLPIFYKLRSDVISSL